MSTSSIKLDQLRLATPCPKSWEQMKGDERVRFCDHCQLNVYNISEFSRVEAQALIAATEGRLCGRLYRRADGAILTKDCPVGLRALRQRLAKRVAAVFAIVAGLAPVTFGQQSKKDKASCVSQTRIARASESTAIPSSITGTVTDLIPAIVPWADITITNTDTQQTYRLKTNDEGVFQSASLPDGTYSVKINHPAFRGAVINDIKLKDNRSITIEVLLEAGGHYETVGLLLAAPEPIQSTPGTTILDERAIRRLPINR